STCFYLAWMLVLTMFIAGLIIGLRWRRSIIRYFLSNLRPIGILAGVAAAGLAIGLIPLFVIYLPVLGVLPGPSLAEYQWFAPLAYDVVNVSSWNVIWGWLLDTLLAPGKGHRVEQALAVTP